MPAFNMGQLYSYRCAEDKGKMAGVSPKSEGTPERRVRARGLQG